jgi:hypothetical protein
MKRTRISRILNGGRTRAGTWDPLIKSLMFYECKQLLSCKMIAE